MPPPARYMIQAFKRRGGVIASIEAHEAGDEDAAYRRGRVMQGRVDGLAFFRIETSAEGDQWTEVTLLSTVGDVPAEEAA